MIPALDEALSLAERLRDELEAVALAAADHPLSFASEARPFRDLADAADDLCSRIDLTRTDQR